MSTTTTNQQDTPSLKQSLRLITALIHTSPPVFYDSRRPALRSVFSSPGGLSGLGTPVSASGQGATIVTPADRFNSRAPSRQTSSYESPLTVHAPLDFPGISPSSRTRAVSLVLPQSPSERMPVGKLQVRDKADQPGKHLLRPIPKRSSTISPEIGHHTWGSLPPPRAPEQLSPPTECLARFTLSPPTGTMAPNEYVCESPSSAVDSSSPGGIRSGLARPCVSQIEVTSTWSMPMTTVDRVGPRLSKWEDRLSLPREPSLRRSVSLRNGIRDSEGSAHKRNYSDSLLQILPAIQSGIPHESSRMLYLAHRPAPPVPAHEVRPTTRRSRTPIPYSIGKKSGEHDRLSTLSRRTSTGSLACDSPKRGRSASVRDLDSPHPSPAGESESKPLGAWERVGEGASATVRSRRGSFASIWSTSRLASDVHTMKPDGDALTRAAGLDLEVEGDIEDLQTTKNFENDDEVDDFEVFIGFDDM